MISLNIDVNKIDKERLYKGVKGTYLDAVLIETPNSEYGDYMIVESTTKEEREAGKKGTILGNAKIIGSKTISTYPDEPVPKDPPQLKDIEPAGDNGPDDLPF